MQYTLNPYKSIFHIPNYHIKYQLIFNIYSINQSTLSIKYKLNQSTLSQIYIQIHKFHCIKKIININNLYHYKFININFAYLLVVEKKGGGGGGKVVVAAPAESCGGGCWRLGGQGLKGWEEEMLNWE